MLLAIFVLHIMHAQAHDVRASEVRWRLQVLMKNGMTRDLSWDRSAEEYEQIFRCASHTMLARPLLDEHRPPLLVGADGRSWTQQCVRGEQGRAPTSRDRVIPRTLSGVLV